MKKEGYFGNFGGRFVPEALRPPLMELEEAMDSIMPSREYRDALQDLLVHYAGRETPLTFCPHLSEKLGFRLWLKREDLLHTGAHKINNALGQALLAKMMGKTHLIAETGAGQHGVATATAAARLNMDCTIFMGAEDVERQSMNVMRMKLLGATVFPIESGSRTLKDAINEALRYWISHQADTLYCFGTAAGPHPFPTLVRQLQSVIGREARAQMLERAGRLPDVVVACVGGGSNSIGMFADFIEEPLVKLIGVEAAGKGIETGEHASAMALGEPGVLHGMRSYLLQDEDGNVKLAHSISAGLDYPGVGPEHAYLRDSGRATYVSVTDTEAMDALMELCKLEVIIPAIESAHAVAYASKYAKELTEKLGAAEAKDKTMIICLSGRVNTIRC